MFLWSVDNMQGRLKGCTHVSEYVEINTYNMNTFRRERKLEIQDEADLWLFTCLHLQYNFKAIIGGID